LVVPDLRGKHGRLRTVPVPAWVKTALDDWTAAAGITEGRLLRSVNHAVKVLETIESTCTVDNSVMIM
jgi:hypothetical protein